MDTQHTNDGEGWNTLAESQARRASEIDRANPDACTPGLMRFEEDGEANRYSMLDDGGRWWLALLHNGEAVTERQRANMRRLAACWNACHGISTATLEALPGGTIAEELARLAAAAGDTPTERDPIAVATSYGGRFTEEDGAWFCVGPQGIGASGATKHEAAGHFCEQFNL